MVRIVNKQEKISFGFCFIKRISVLLIEAIFLVSEKEDQVDTHYFVF